MDAKHASETQPGKRLTYHGPNHVRWSTPAAPTFDAIGMPKRNNYRPQASPIHSSDVAIAHEAKARRKEERKANRVYARSQGKFHPRAVVLRRADGSTLPTFKHAEAMTARVVQPKRQIGKTVDLAHVTQDATHAKAGTYYPPLHSEPIAPVLTVETVQSVARTRNVSAFVDILDRLAPCKMRPEGLDYHDTIRETVREKGTEL